ILYIYIYIYFARLNLFWTKKMYGDCGRARLSKYCPNEIDQDYIIKFVTVSRSFNAVV
ncbi:unnamed protein product, partial [Brassica napus]